MQLGDARLAGTDLRGALELGCEELRSARDWRESYRDERLACGAPRPATPEQRVRLPGPR